MHVRQRPEAFPEETVLLGFGAAERVELQMRCAGGDLPQQRRNGAAPPVDVLWIEHPHCYHLVRCTKRASTPTRPFNPPAAASPTSPALPQPHMTSNIVWFD